MAAKPEQNALQIPQSRQAGMEGGSVQHFSECLVPVGTTEAMQATAHLLRRHNCARTQ
jgi:hypothetical protein